MTKIKFSTSQFLAALALAAAIGLMIQAIKINPASALEGEPVPETTEETTTADHVSNQTQLVAALADATISTITVDANFETNANMEINRDVVIDLGGHTISNAAANARIFSVNHGQVTIKNGTLDATGTGGAPVRLFGSENPNADNYTVVTIERNVTLKNVDNYGAFVSHINHHAYGVKLNFNGTIVGGNGLYVNGFVADKTGDYPQINIGNDAKINVSDMGIYAAGYAQWTIGSATINAGNVAARAASDGTGIGAKAGIFNLNGTTITATGAKVDAGTNNNGMQGAGAVFQVENNDSYAGDTQFTINGGTYTSANNAVFYQHASGAQNLKSITINGGTFKAGDGQAIFALSDGSTGEVKVTAGTFNQKVPENFLVGNWQQEEVDGNWVVAVTPSDPGTSNPTNPSTPSQPKDDQDDVTIPNTGARNHGSAVNAIASVSLVVSIFVAGGIFYNRYKVYHRVKAYVPNPSVNRIRKK